MPHIHLENDLPGIRGLFAFRPETARPISELAQILLHDDNSLPRAHREIIGAFVSFENDCRYCHTSHGAIAAHHLKGNEQLIDDIRRNFETADIPEQLKALLAIARKVCIGGRNVTEDYIARARSHGATDLEMHDAVLIAALFCLCNRYVDGLATFAPADEESYRQRAAGVAANGYMKLIQDLEVAAK